MPRHNVFRTVHAVRNQPGYIPCIAILSSQFILQYGTRRFSDEVAVSFPSANSRVFSSLDFLQSGIRRAVLQLIWCVFFPSGVM